MKPTQQWVRSFQELARNPEKLQAALRQVKLDEHWCQQCGETISQFEKFCPHCGKESKDFSPEAFAQIMGETIEQTVQNECRKGHQHSGNEEEKAARQGYCYFCGQFLGKVE